MVWIAMTLGPAAAGIVQTVTGFGSVVLMMLVFPFFFNMLDAPSLALAINMLYCLVLCWKYRKSIDFKAALWPTLTYSVVCFAVTGLVKGSDLHGLVIIFACFLMALSLYLLLVSHRVQMKKPGAGAGIAFGTLAGVSAGAFAIGGPMIAPFMMAATQSHISYVASMQFIFAVTNIVNLSGRIVNGIFNRELWPYVAVGSVCILIGMKAGEAIAKRIDPGKLRLVVYAFVGISGLILLLQNV